MYEHIVFVLKKSEKTFSEMRFKCQLADVEDF